MNGKEERYTPGESNEQTRTKNLPEKKKPIETTAEIKSPRQIVNASNCSEQEKLSTNNPGPTYRTPVYPYSEGTCEIETLCSPLIVAR